MADQVSAVQEAPATERTAILATAVYNLTDDVIAQAIADGDIREGGIVDVTVKAGALPGLLKDEAQPYHQLVAITWEGMVLLSGSKAEPQTPRTDDKVDGRSEAEKAKGAPDHFNYGLDLEVKRALRRVLESEISGPGKAIEKAAKALFENKLFPNMDAARAHVRSMRQSAGLDA